VTRWLLVLMAAAALVAGAAWLGLGRVAQPPAAASASATSTAHVVRTDLVTTQPVAGTIGYGTAATLAIPTTTTPQVLAQAQAAVTTATNKLAADQVAAGDTRAADQATLNPDQQSQQTACAASTTSAACVGAQQKVAQDQARERQDDDQARATQTADQATLAQAQQALAQAQALAGSPGNFYTGLAGAGSVVAQGGTLYWIDGRPVPLLYGPLPAYRALRQGVSGPDVRQLEQDLIALGFANSSTLTVDGDFTGADVGAVKRWQAALGVAQTGAVNLGDAIFLPGPIRVTGLRASVGGAAQGGQPVLDYSSTTKTVTVALAPALAAQVKTGDAVMVDMPDGHTRTPGRVSDMSTVATATSTTGQGSQTQNGAAQVTIGATVTFDSPDAVAAVDQAPVTVDITTQSAPGVLAVPVNALLALAGGGYGVEVVGPGGQHRLLAVQTGIYDNSRVQVSGTGLTEGMTVVVPAS
jgi:multidrug efflux pump subunit AcrA (membrane-fusion protein)